MQPSAITDLKKLDREQKETNGKTQNIQDQLYQTKMHRGWLDEGLRYILPSGGVRPALLAGVPGVCGTMVWT